jgi:hypothetical protein
MWPFTRTPKTAITFDEFCRRAELVPIGQPIRTKVRGVSFNNANGERRELIIQTRCQAGDALLLLREPENEYDSNAIAVTRLIDKDGKNVEAVDMLGHISRDLAERLAPDMDAGETIVAEVKNVTGDLEPDVDGDDGYNAGLNITIYRMKKVNAVGA